MSARGITKAIGAWRVFLNWHGKYAPPRLWGYRYNSNHGRPIRNFIIFWCEISWWRA